MRYRSLREYLALGVVPRIPRKVPRVSRYWILPLLYRFHVRGLSLSLAGLFRTVPLTNQLTYAVRNPRVHALWFGLFPISLAATLESMFLSLPPPT